MSRNKDRYVVNADIQHHWIGAEDRFWYERTNAVGEKKVVIVDATSGKQALASEQEKFPTHQSAVANEAVSPDGKWAAFVRDHNLWVRSTSGEAEFALTTDGAEHYEYAGAQGSRAPVSELRHPQPTPPQVVWSPDSRFILTYRLDRRRLKDMFLIQSVPEDGSVRPKLYAYRWYALVGDEHLPMAEPVVVEVAARRNVSLDTPPLICSILTFIEKRDAWWSHDSSYVYYLNRDRYSKSVRLERADPRTGAVTTVLVETSDTVAQTSAGGIFDFPLVRTLSNGDVIWYSQRDGWGHLYYYGAAGQLRNRITRGRWAVRDVIEVDERRGRIYFMGSGREAGRDPYEQYLYSVRFDGSGLRLLTPEPGDHAWPHLLLSALETDKRRFSASGRYFVDSPSQPNTPPILTIRAADGRLIKQLETADISKLRVGGYAPVEPFQVLASDGKTAIYGNLFRPSTFDRSRKYPVIDAMYPGPYGTRTRKSFAAALFDPFEAQSLAELGFIVITIDGRGTAYRSKAFLDHAYGRMEKASDLDDHIAGIRQLAQRYPYLDLDRVGADGVSAGGVLATEAILQYPDFYSVAVAAEGNHDHRAFEASWVETFSGPMRVGKEPAYSTLPFAANLKGKLFLMHGEMDDAVPPAMTLKLVDALIKANKDFDLLILPNANHTAFTASSYFIRRKWNYFVRHLLNAEPPAHYAIEPAP